MKITTRDFGELEIKDDSVVTIPDGIIGFEDVQKYAIISPLGDEKFPMWLQAVEKPEPCFVVYDPWQIYPDYAFEIDEETQNLLKAKDDEEMRLLAVAIIPEDYKKTTINLRCPIVLNPRTNIAVQVLLEDYEFKYPVYESDDSDKSDKAEGE